MRGLDPLSPRQRARVDGEPDVAALARALLNEMLDRLEIRSRREKSTRMALRVLEDERKGMACELHDEVGQILTGRHAAGGGACRDDPSRVA